MKKTRNAFTLVELIIVIVILAILATIAFLSYKSYSDSAKDGKRMSNVVLMAKWFEVNISLWKYIDTSDVSTTPNIVLSWSTIAYSWYYSTPIKEKLLKSLWLWWWDINAIWSEDYNNYKFTYIPNIQKYQVACLLNSKNNFNSFNDFKTSVSADNLNWSWYIFLKWNYFATWWVDWLIPKQEVWDTTPWFTKIIPGNKIVTNWTISTPSDANCISWNYSSSWTQVYNLPSLISNWTSYSWVTNILVANWSRIFSANLNCNNWIITISGETVVNNCNTNYSWDWNSCIKAGSSMASAWLWCKDIVDKWWSNWDWIYWIDPDWAWSIMPAQLYCKMSAWQWALVAWVKSNGENDSNVDAWFMTGNLTNYSDPSGKVSDDFINALMNSGRKEIAVENFSWWKIQITAIPEWFTNWQAYYYNNCTYTSDTNLYWVGSYCSPCHRAAWSYSLCYYPNNGWSLQNTTAWSPSWNNGRFWAR